MYKRWVASFGGCRFVALVKSRLGKDGTTDFQVRPWGVRRTRKSVVPLKQPTVTHWVVIDPVLPRIHLGYLFAFIYLSQNEKTFAAGSDKGLIRFG